MLYRQLLKDDFEKLPRALREFHSAPGGGRALGTVAVRHARGMLARLAGFPRSGEGIPLRLEVEATGDREVWVRRFGDDVLRTTQQRQGDLLLETMGPVRVLFRLAADGKGIRFESERTRLWMIPLPVRVTAMAAGGDSSWEFEVTVSRIGSYRGAVVRVL